MLLTAAAYVLMQELRLRAARTACARTQVTWLRDRLLKLGPMSSARPVASSCTCRRRRRTYTRGDTSPSPSARGWDSAPARPARLPARPRRSCLSPVLARGIRAPRGVRRADIHSRRRPIRQARDDSSARETGIDSFINNAG